MDQRIGTLRCRYRLLGDQSGSLLTRRLDRIAGDGLAEQLAVDLDRWFDDDTVYVVRQARATQVLDGRFADDGPLTRAWAAGLAKSIAAAAIIGPGDGSQVVTFDSNAAYVAAFVVDLLDGRAWDRWYYGPFSRYRGRPLGDAMVSVLTDHGPELIDVLAHLERRGRLEALFRTVDPAALGLGHGVEADGAPRDAFDGSSSPAVDEWRPVVAAALRVIDRLGATPREPSLERAVARWVATGPPALDWRDEVGLTDAVAAVTRWLLAADAGSSVDVDGDASVAAVRAEAWLDPDRLTIGLDGIGGIGGRPDTLGDRPPRATPRQRSLVVAVRRGWSERRPALDASAPRSAANAGRLLAALAVVEPDWSDDPSARRFIELLLEGWEHVRTGGAVAAGRERGGLDPGPTAVERLGTYGPEATELLTAIAGVAPGPDGSDGWTSSGAAGVLLLARVVNDTRLAGLAAHHRYPPAGPSGLLAAVAWRWAGPEGMVDGIPDPAVAVLAGTNGPTDPEGLAEAWSFVTDEDHDRWWDVVLATLAPGPDVGAFEHAHLRLPSADVAHDATAAALIRSWARWLRGFERSSVTFLLDRLVRRPGHLLVRSDEILVRLPRRPLDTVLEVAGYLRPIEAVPGLTDDALVFELEDEP